MIGSRDGVSQRIAVVPAYNEAPTVAGVLDKLAPLVDLLVIVDDGSTDDTRAEIQRWLMDHENAGASLLRHQPGHVCGVLPRLHRVARAARRRPAHRRAISCVPSTPTASTISSALDAMIETTRKQGLDALLAQRYLGDYPPFKQFGNRVMSVWATLWAGIPLPDVESGYRIFRLGALAEALDYYRGFRYSETVEVAVVLARLGYRVRNDFLVPVPVFRSRTSLLDAAIDLSVIPVAWWRVMRHQSRLVAASDTGAAATTGRHRVVGGPGRPTRRTLAARAVGGPSDQSVEPHGTQTACPESVQDQRQGPRHDRPIDDGLPSSPSCRSMIEPGRTDRPGPDEPPPARRWSSSRLADTSQITIRTSAPRRPTA